MTLLAPAGCSATAPEVPPPVTERAPVAVDKLVPPSPDVPPTWPLTGTPAPDAPPRPALAVKIENPPSVRPQTGLEAADMVWEQVVEGGITRFVVVYHSNVPEVVGPIRSVRPMDPAIVAPLGGVIAFSGGVTPYIDALVAAGVQVVSNDDGHPGFARRSGIEAPHNVFGTPATFLAQADAGHQEPPGPQLRIARRPDLVTATTIGSPATSLQLTMSTASSPGWTWDAAGGAWLRSEAGVPARAASGARLSAANVVVLRANLVDSGARDSGGNVVPETQLVGTGEALVASGGHTVPATWTKTGVGDPIELATADGRPVLMTPGTTWVELVPNGTGSVVVQ
jgi:Protein of unknown function (DUF3048) N-terminal domain/Protein of unknown function (DUF3048) C-terminal domain